MELDIINSKNDREMEEISKLLDLENIHLSEENNRATYVGKFDISIYLMRKIIDKLQSCKKHSEG